MASTANPERDRPTAQRRVGIEAGNGFDPADAGGQRIPHPPPFRRGSTIDIVHAGRLVEQGLAGVASLPEPPRAAVRGSPKRNRLFRLRMNHDSLQTAAADLDPFRLPSRANALSRQRAGSPPPSVHAGNRRTQRRHRPPRLRHRRIDPQHDMGVVTITAYATGRPRMSASSSRRRSTHSRRYSNDCPSARLPCTPARARDGGRSRTGRNDEAMAGGHGHHRRPSGKAGL